MEGRRTHHSDPRGLGWCGPTSPFHPTTPAEVRSLTSLAHDCLAVQLFRHMAPGLSTLAVACSRLPFCLLLWPSHSACLRPSRCGPVTGGSCLHDVLPLSLIRTTPCIISIAFMPFQDHCIIACLPFVLTGPRPFGPPSQSLSSDPIRSEQSKRLAAPPFLSRASALTSRS